VALPDAACQPVPANGGSHPRNVAALPPLTPAGEQSLTTKSIGLTCQQSRTVQRKNQPVRKSQPVLDWSTRCLMHILVAVRARGCELSTPYLMPWAGHCATVCLQWARSLSLLHRLQHAVQRVLSDNVRLVSCPAMEKFLAQAKIRTLEHAEGFVERHGRVPGLSQRQLRDSSVL
jgi:hypothetical protein